MDYPSLRIKICGITRQEDSLAAAALGADAIGLNFYVSSPRYIDPAAAAAILRSLPPFVEPVGLFVNEPFDRIVHTLTQLGRIRTIQWHGDNPETNEGSNYQWIVAFGVREEVHLRRIEQYLESCREVGKLPNGVLVDAQVPGQYGGTGRIAAWDLLAEFRPEVPLILAGGLAAENVAEAIRIVRPYAVDVASGVERSPGIKDREKMARFIGNAREAAAKYLS